MATTYWTIESNGVEKTLAQWGISNLQRSRVQLGVSTVTIQCAGRRVDAAELFPYASTVIIRYGRSLVAGVWTGGTRWFYGRVEPWTRRASGGKESQSCDLVGVFWYLTRRAFKQIYRNFAGYTTPGNPNTPPTFTEVETAHLFLCMKVLAPYNSITKITTGAQMQEVLQYFADKGAPFQVGTCSPVLDAPIDEVKNLTGAEVLAKMWRWSPDAIVWVDETTEPYPTIHCYRASDCTDVSIDLNAGAPLTDLVIKPRPDWRKAYVHLQYEQVNDGRLTTIDDIWPSPKPTDAESGFNGFETVVDLVGRQSTTIQTTIVTQAHAITNLNWWRAKIPTLLTGTEVLSVAFNTGDVQSLEARSDTAETPNGALGQEILDGSWAPWISGTSAQSVRAKCQVKITLRNGEERIERLHHDLVITNAVSGTYASTSVTQDADPVPVGLAHDMYDAFNNLAAEGSVTLRAAEVPSTINFDKRLNFITPLQPAWATLRALVQTLDDDVVSGTLTCKFGAPEHLTAGELVDLLRVARNRQINTSYGTRRGAATAGGTALGRKVPERNSQAGARANAILVAAATPDGTGERIQHDGKNNISVWRTGSGPANSTPVGGYIKLERAKVFNEGVEVREIEVCDSVTGQKMYCLIPRSLFYPTPKTSTYNQ